MSRARVGVVLTAFVLLQTAPSTQVQPRFVSIDLPLVQTPASSGNYQSGRIASIAVDPTDANHWLLGVGNGGVWESRDAGDTWTPLTDDAPTLAIGAVAFAPSDPNIIYAATGEATAQAFTRSGMGMLKSTDGGRTWALIGAASLARGAIRRVRVHPENPNVLTVTVSRGGNGRDSRIGTPGSPPFGILKSSDGGASWVRTLPGRATALEVDPANFNNQYAAIGETLSNPTGENNDAPGGRPNGLYRSGDGGQTWNSIAGPWEGSRTVGHIELAIAPSNPNVLYAAIATPEASTNTLLGLYRTDNAWDAAPTWIQIPTEATGSGAYCGGSKCSYSHVLSVDPADPNRLFAAGARIWRCDDCKSSPRWSGVQGNTHADFHALAWAGNRFITGNDGGVWSTTDLGRTWRNHNRALPTLMFFSAALHPTDPEFMLAGLRDFPASVRTDSKSFVVLPQLPSPGHWGEGEVLLSSQRPETDWMVAENWGGIYRTTDGGRTAIFAGPAILRTSTAFVAPVRKCPANDNVVLTGNVRMWRTNDFFSSATPLWSVNSSSTYPDRHYSFGTIYSIAFAASDTSCNTYAYGIYAGEVYLTRDGGRTWTNLDPAKTLPPRAVNSVAFDPVDANIAYVALSSFDDATPNRPGHVFKSTNAMSASPSWVNVSPVLNQPFNVVAIDPVSRNLVYAGSDTGLWRSVDDARTWQRMDLAHGLPPATVYDIQINPVTKRTVILTYGRGAYALESAP